MKQSTFETGRISALSDGIFAIAMTLLVLDLKLPEIEPDSLAEDFVAMIGNQGSRFLSWLLSFAILCRLWITQHSLLVDGENRSRGFVGWNFLFLSTISFLPFSTSLLGEHHDQPLSVIIFSASLAIGGGALLGMVRSLQRHRASESRISRIGNMPKKAIVILFVTAAVAICVSPFSPGAGTTAWIAFPIIATLAEKRRDTST